MAKWGSVDIKELQKLQKKLWKLEKVDYDAFLKRMTKNIALRFLRRVIKRTPVDKGQLKNGWTVGKVSKKGHNYEIEIINKKTYASYVEFGHRQHIGRFVPAIGKRLVKGWVEGRFMMTISEAEIRKIAPKIIEKEYAKLLGGVFDGK